MLAGTETALARVVAVFGEARPHCAYLFANRRATRMQLLVHDGTVHNNSETAITAKKMATQACASAVKGGQVVGTVVTTMQNIAASSKNIADIIRVIDGIAFQINILARDASVEAARAGEQGRGFAVVAGEVRRASRAARPSWPRKSSL